MVFDLGGTTIRDRGEVPAAFAAALEAAGLTADAATVASWRGASKREALHHLLGTQRPALAASDRDALTARIYGHFSSLLAERLRAAEGLAIPEALAAFERIKGAGMRIALNSGFDRAIVDLILAATRWPLRLFDAVVSSDDVRAGRPAPDMILRSMERSGVTDPARVAVVGDTRLDLEAGANARVAYRIGVLTGAHDRATLESGPYTHIVDSVSAVPGLWLDGGGR